METPTRRTFLGTILAAVGLSRAAQTKPEPTPVVFDWKAYPGWPVVIDPECPPDVMYFLQDRTVVGRIDDLARERLRTHMRQVYNECSQGGAPPNCVIHDGWTYVREDEG